MEHMDGNTHGSAGCTEREGYDPNPLLDALIAQLRLKNDAALCRALGVSPPIVSKIRHRCMAVSASLLIRMHEISGMSIQELRRAMGDRRKTFRIGGRGGRAGGAG